MFKVWQNSAPFCSRPIGGVVEALLTKVVNLQSSVLSIVGFFVAAAGSVSAGEEVGISLLTTALPLY
jgi:hypothetical protein